MLSKFASNLGYDANTSEEVAKKINKKIYPGQEIPRDVIINWGRFLIAVNEGRRKNICPFYY